MPKGRRWHGKQQGTSKTIIINHKMQLRHRQSGARHEHRACKTHAKHKQTQTKTTQATTKMSKRAQLLNPTCQINRKHNTHHGLRITKPSTQSPKWMWERQLRLLRQLLLLRNNLRRWTSGWRYRWWQGQATGIGIMAHQTSKSCH